MDADTQTNDAAAGTNNKVGIKIRMKLLWEYLKQKKPNKTTPMFPKKLTTAKLTVPIE